MRPTLLQFRNPKERTPDPYDIRVTCDGSPLGCIRSKSPTFGRDKRFRQYDNEARKTGYRIGPGSYSSLTPGKVKGGMAYKPLFGIKADPKECFYVGQLLVREPNLINQGQTEQEWQKKVDFSRPTTASDNLPGTPMKFRMKKKAAALSRNLSRNRINPKLE